MTTKKRVKRKLGRFWSKMLSEQARSGQSVRAFCQQRRLTESTFNYWQRELRNRDQEFSVAATATLLEPGEEQPPASIGEQATRRNKKRRTLGHDSVQRVAVAEADVDQQPQTTKKQPANKAASEIAREERYRLTDSSGTRVEVAIDSNRELATLEMELVDISQGGVRLRTKTPVAEKELLTVSIIPRGFPRSLSTRAQVRWTTFAPKATYWLGCSIEPRIPQALFDHLAANGILERRHEARQKVSIALPAYWELDPTQCEASILNISQGGVCLLISRDGNPGDRIRLTLPGDHQRPTHVLLTACWQVTTDEGYILGCKFRHLASYEKLTRLLDGQGAQ
jgi:hypothetical protein